MGEKYPQHYLCMAVIRLPKAKSFHLQFPQRHKRSHQGPLRTLDYLKNKYVKNNYPPSKLWFYTDCYYTKYSSYIRNLIHLLGNFWQLFFPLKCYTDELGSLLCTISSTVKFQHSPANLSFQSYNKDSGKLQVFSYKGLCFICNDLKKCYKTKQELYFAKATLEPQINETISLIQVSALSHDMWREQIASLHLSIVSSHQSA